MSDPKPLTNPYLSLYIFFSDDEGTQLAHEWGDRFARQLRVPLFTLERLPFADENQNFCMIYPQHEAWVVYASVELKGEQPLSAWQELSELLFGPEWELWQELQQKIWPDLTESEDERESVQMPPEAYWGSTLFFGAQVASLDLNFEAEKWLPSLPLLPGSEFMEPTPLSKQEWGKLWQLAGLSEAAPEAPHLYLLLATSEHIKRVRKTLFQIDNLDLIALSLHKCYHHLEQYELTRETLYMLIDNLDELLIQLLEQSTEKRENLTALSKQYLNLAIWSSKVTELENTVSINSTNYHRIANDLKLLHDEDDLFTTHSRQLKHGQEQLEADRIYYQAAIQRLSTGLEALRAEFELRLVETEHQAAESWREFVKQNDERKELELRREQAEAKREIERRQREEVQEKEESKRENQRNLLIGELGLLLGLIQIWEPIQNILQSRNFNLKIQQGVDNAFLFLIIFLGIVLLWQVMKLRLQGN